jgi:multidrug efflux pump subunit AcrA (membrane-fusion protein)
MAEKSGKKTARVLKEVGKGLGLLLLLVVMMLWLSGAFIAKVQPGPPLKRKAPTKLKTQKVLKTVFPLFMEQVGNLRARTQAQISSRIMSQVKEILVREGDQVTGGEGEEKTPTLMARLDDRDIRAKLQEAEAQVQAMKRGVQAATAKLGAAKAQVEAAAANWEQVLSDYRRYQDLHRQQAATGQRLEHARAQKQVAEAQLLAARKEVDAVQREIERIQAQMEQARAAAEGARVMLSYTEIRAPFAGRLVKKMVDVGDMAAPGQPLFFVEISSRPELHAFVSDSLIPHLRIGQAMEVQIDALNRSLTGDLREIILKSDPATRTVLVKIGLPSDTGLVNGLFGRLKVPYGNYEALVIPSVAVREVGQLYLVDVLDGEGSPQRRFVTLGPHHDGRVEVLSGLKEGEEVVIP